MKLFPVGASFVLFGNKYTVVEQYITTIDVEDGFFFLDDLLRWYRAGLLSIIK